MSELDCAMMKHISNIVLEEHRPFSYRDFLRFEVDGKEYRMQHGTFRNKISQLIRAMECPCPIYLKSILSLKPTLSIIGNVSSSTGILILHGQNDSGSPVQQAFLRR
jgi:hypothetical protein